MTIMLLWKIDIEGKIIIAKDRKEKLKFERTLKEKFGKEIKYQDLTMDYIEIICPNGKKILYSPVTKEVFEKK